MESSAFLWLVVAHVLLVLACCVHRTHCASEGRGKEDIPLKHAIKSMLGFKELSLQSPNDMAPQYMLDLYEKYKSGGIHNGRVAANTVRSIHAEIGKCSGFLIANPCYRYIMQNHPPTPSFRA